MPLSLLVLPLLAAAQATYTNPIQDRDLPDPGVVRDGGALWMTHTMGGPDVGWPLYRSTDGVRWTFREHLLTTANKAAWMQDAFWAPEILRANPGSGPARYLLTFTAWSPVNRHLCIGMASAPTIEGPYTVRSTPLVAEGLDVLDSHLFRDDDGRLILYWKRNSENPNDRPGVNGDLRAQRLDATGLAFAPGSVPTVVLRGTAAATAPSVAWERGLVEAPFVLRRGGYYFLFYSGAFIDTSYAVGTARSLSPFGPFARNPWNPVLRSNAAWGGPGHGAFFQDDAKTIFHLYHARHAANPDFGRVQVMDRVGWLYGWPTFAGNGPSSRPQTAPVILGGASGGPILP